MSGGTAGRAWGLAAALCALVVALDQVARALAEARLSPGKHVEVVGPLGLTLSHNRGVAFGLASGGGAALVAVTVVALALVLVLFARSPARSGMWVAVGLLAGGALGNLIDRLRTGAVTDYVDVRLLSWPPFNLADVSIAIGILLLALIYVRESAPADG
ncbi:MAG TPA: signal peptidase II [Solirubrobacterales bacterium]|nr:signal peptidase II [Solirubrobacterales bacterium]